jgi:hypothetical protein
MTGEQPLPAGNDGLAVRKLSDLPWTRLDELVRAELAAGRTTKQINANLFEMSDEVWGTPGLPEDGTDAFGETLDALTGDCHPDCQYQDPPSPTPPSEAIRASENVR